MNWPQLAKLEGGGIYRVMSAQIADWVERIKKTDSASCEKPVVFVKLALFS